MEDSIQSQCGSISEAPIDKDEAEAHSLSRPSPIGTSVTANHILPSLSGARQVDRACNASGGQIGPRHNLGLKTFFKICIGPH